MPLVCFNGAKGVVVVRASNKDEENKNEIISHNGSSNSYNPMINGSLEITEMFHCPLSQDLTMKTLKLAKEIECVVNYYIDHEIFAHPEKDWHYDFIAKYGKLTGINIKQCSDDYKSVMQRGCPSKLLIACRPADIDDVVKKVESRLKEEARVIRGSPAFFVEILDKSVHKGRGLERMCRFLGVDLNDVIAFGDGDNDKQFLQIAGRGIAMKNGREHVKAIADEVTEWTNEEASF